MTSRNQFPNLLDDYPNRRSITEFLQVFAHTLFSDELVMPKELLQSLFNQSLETAMAGVDGDFPICSGSTFLFERRR